MNLQPRIGLAALGLCLLLSSGPALAQSGEPAPYQEGLHYFKIDQAPVQTGDVIELVEAFSYLCTHCNTFEPYLDRWFQRKPDHVQFTRIAAVFGRDSWETYARAYVTAQMMKVPEEAHKAMMDRLWNERKIMRTMEELADFYSQFGLDQDKFLSTTRSFAVDSKLRRDQQRIQEYGIRGTPALVLNGKYRISANAAVSNYDVMMQVVDYLVEKETAEMQKTAAPGAAADNAESDSP
jgi:thiol:disulfide interchange protein DsbA